MVAKCAQQLTWNFHCCVTALNRVDSAFFGAVEDRKWPGGIGGYCLACRWPVLIQYHLQSSRATSSTVACATQWVLLIVSGVYRRRKMRASHPGSQKGGRKAERCMFHCAQWHWRTSTSSPLMVEVAPVTSISPTVECPTFSQAQRLLLLVFCFFCFFSPLEAKEIFCLFKRKLFSINSKFLIPLLQRCFSLESDLCHFIFLFFYFTVSHKHPRSLFITHKSPFIVVPSPKSPSSACVIVRLCSIHMRVHTRASCLCFKHNNIWKQAGLLQS